MAGAGFTLPNTVPYRALVGSLLSTASSVPTSLSNPSAPNNGVPPSPPAGNPLTLNNAITGASSGTDYNITFDVVEEEQHTDELTITDHPVEQGAAVTDNAYKNPAMVVLTCGFTSSGSVPAFQHLPGANSDAGLQKLYAFLLQIQLQRVPLTVYTGKRTYNSMLLKSIATRSDYKTAHSLPLTLVFREIIIVQTSSVIVSSDQSVQAFPQKTTPPVANGTKQLTSGAKYVPLDSPGFFGE